MTSSQNKIKQNEEVWNQVAEKFKDASALPVWGPFGVGEDLKLIPEIGDKTFLEICCGSGRSINYLIKEGARHVVGIDFSEAQITEATTFNQEAIDAGKITLYQSPMEEFLHIEPVDYAFSVYGIGWTHDPEKTLANIFTYLKPGGEFIWSWDHSIFPDIGFEDSRYVVKGSYHDEDSTILSSWKQSEGTAHIAYRKTSTWFQLLRDAGFEVINYYEPKPVNMSRGKSDLASYYSVHKARILPCTMIFRCRKPT